MTEPTRKHPSTTVSPDLSAAPLITPIAESGTESNPPTRKGSIDEVPEAQRGGPREGP